ncbi:MAG: hypothetical protein H7177_16750, partial [Rhizobacter sp.]|nr:hypothetical protein [Bacteriovorax sp.]
MKLCFLTLLFFLFSITTLFAEDKIPSCKLLIAEAKKSIIEMRDNMKAGKDIDIAFDLLEKKIKQYSDCLSFKKLLLSNNQVAKFRAYTYTPDRTFNLKRKDCSEYKVDTTNMPKNNDQGPLGWC